MPGLTFMGIGSVYPDPTLEGAQAGSFADASSLGDGRNVSLPLHYVQHFPSSIFAIVLRPIGLMSQTQKNLQAYCNRFRIP